MKNNDNKLKIALLIHRLNLNDAGTIYDHINAFSLYSKNEIIVFNLANWEYSYFYEIQKVDVIVLHYTASILYDCSFPVIFRYYLAISKQLKVLFIQDEYRLVNKVIEGLNVLGIDLLFTCVSEQEMDNVYPLSKLPSIKERINVLTGYVPEELKKMFYNRPAYEERTFDVVYRARKLSNWYGRLAREKWIIANRFKQEAKIYNLKVDISYLEEKRIYRENWIKFLQQSKAVLGVESGASVFDFTGEIQKQVEEYEKINPNIGFEELEKMFFPNLDGKIYINQISPRCFECATLGTLMILYEGNYSGILKPWQHYVPLKKDHSNIAEVIKVLNDKKSWEEITLRAYEEIANNSNYSYKHMIDLFDEAVDRHYKKENIVRFLNCKKLPLIELVIKKILKFSFKFAYKIYKIFAYKIYKIIDYFFLKLWKNLEIIHRNYNLLAWITIKDLFKITRIVACLRSNHFMVDHLTFCLMVDIDNLLFNMSHNSFYNLQLANNALVISFDFQSQNNICLAERLWNCKKNLKTINTIIINNNSILLPGELSKINLTITKNKKSFANITKHLEVDKQNSNANITKHLEIDKQNSNFWDELCGTSLAQTLGISQNISQHALTKYDDAFFKIYPYLQKYLNMIPCGGKVLEIGLGYGTISTYLAKRAEQYFGLDIANGPIYMVNTRLGYLNKEKEAKLGSAHDIPFSNEFFDAVVSIGCFHHTGNIQKCIQESYRVLKKGGILLFMCYNKHSFRILYNLPKAFFSNKDVIRLNESASALYDINSKLEAAPCTDIAGRKYYQKICSQFAETFIYCENWDGSNRIMYLNNLAKLFGLDLYVFCRK